MAILGNGILKRIKRNAELSHLKQHYKLLFTHFPGACSICDSNGLIIETNELFSDFIQSTKEDLHNKSIFEYFQVEQNNAISIYLDALMKGEIVNLEADIPSKTEIKNTKVTIIPILIKENLIGMYVTFLDNTEEKHLKKSLDLIKENLIYGQQLAYIASWTHDIQKDEIFLSDEVYHILGCSPQEFDGKLENYYSYIHPDDLKEVKEATQGALEGIEYDIEYRVVNPSGLERFVQEKTKVLYDEQKNPVKMIGIMQDITNHKLIENDLKAIGDNLNQAQKVAGVGSWKYNAINDEIFWSEEVYRIHDIEPLDFEKNMKGLLKLVHPEDRLKMQNAVEKCLMGKDYQIEYRIPQNDGTERFILAKGEPVFDERQQVVTIFGTVQDITEKHLLEEKLQQNYEILTKAQSLAHIGSWEMDIARGKIFWSEETYRIFGSTPEQYDETYENFLKFVHPDDIKIIQKVIENPPSEHFFDMEFRIRRHDGSIRNVYQQIEIIDDNDGNPAFVYGTIQDITEKKEVQKVLDLKQETINRFHRRFQVLVQESTDVFEIISSDGTIQYISPTIEKIIGYKPEERIGKNVFQFFEKKEKLKLTKMLESTLKDADKVIRNDFTIKTRLGKEINLELVMTNQLAEPVIQGIVINWRDITRRREMESNMDYIASHDELTQLPNRVYFKKRINLQCEGAKTKESLFALLILDINGFKYINDALGDKLADQLLIQITQKLKTFLGDEQFISRYSGDQFAFIVTGLSKIEEYETLARSIINLFSEPFKVDALELYVSVSIGISIYPEDGQDVESLNKNANIALFRAKNQGKNNFKFHSIDMDIQSYKHFILRNDLNKAIEEEQFKVYFQPIVNLKTNEIMGAEALIRWEHPTWGLVPPDEFIFIAEETGCVIDMGKKLLRDVCDTYKQWLSAGLPAIKVSINYLSIQFYEKNFVDNIKEIIDEFQLNPDFLIIEIVESILVDNFEHVISNIQKLQALGIQVALDDFGTGFSSLEYLHKINIDILKIDRSFIKNVPSEETSTIITKAVINLAQELRIKVVAEGIETWEQLSYLRKLNCYTGQGYLYSKPVSQQDFEKILAKKKCRPIRANDAKKVPFEQRRNYYRINFPQLLEADMSVLEIRGKKAKVGNTKVLINDMGPGGLRFVSNIRFPIKRDIVLQFSSELLGKEIKAYGCPVWIEEIDDGLCEYGIEFTFDENERMTLTGVLNQYQIKLRNNLGFTDGRFTPHSLFKYFKLINKD